MDEMNRVQASNQPIMEGCESIRTLLGAYVDGELDDNEDIVERHLLACAECREAVARIEELAGLLSRAGPVCPSEELRDRIVAAAATRLGSPSQRLARRARRLLPRVAAAVLGAVAIGAVLSNARPRLRDQETNAGRPDVVNALFGTLDNRPVAADPVDEFDDELRRLEARPEAKFVSTIFNEEKQ